MACSYSMLALTEYRKIVVLTGAGVSVASGLRTYRGDASQDLATRESLASRPSQVLLPALLGL